MNSLLFPILSIIAAIGLFFFFISPNLEEINILMEKDAEFSKSLDDVREIENIMAELDSTYAGITQEELLKLNKFLPIKLDETQAAHDISSLVEAEEAILRGRDYFEVGGYYSATTNPQLITIDESWFLAKLSN